MPSERDQLATGGTLLGLTLTDAQLDQLLAYRDLLLRWNKVYNLTAVRDPQQMLTHHLLDSLAVIAPLQRHAAGRTLRILDVGSGGGLPGVVIAIAAPEHRVDCVDTVAKKASFLTQVAAELPLRQLRAHHARVEDLPGPGYDLITSRAFASLHDFVSLSTHLLKPDGVWMAMKGPVAHAEAERPALPPTVACERCEALDVPGLGAERSLVWMHHAVPPG